MATSPTFSTRFGLLLIFLSTLLHAVVDAQTPSASTFTHGGGPQNLSVSLNVPNNNSDTLYFHFNGPATNSWVAFGFGSSMSDSLIFVAYDSADRKNVTLSPRLGQGQVMPDHTDSVQVELLAGSGVINDKVFIVNAKCTGCRSWGSGSLDLKSTAQPMIWAIGPAWSLASDDLNAPIRQHQIHDTFSLDLVAATGPAGVPLLGASTDNSTSNDGSESNGGPGPQGKDTPGKVGAHALLMIGSFLILFPLGYLTLRVFEKVIAHAAVQSFAMLVVVVSTGLGVSISKGMKISPNLTDPHQILGFLILVLVFASWAIGLSGHIMFRKTSQPAKFMIGHRILGPLTMALGLANVCVGFNFAGNRRPIIPFIVVTLLMIIIVSGIVLMFRRRRMRKQAMQTPAAMNFREGQQQASGAPPSYPAATATTGGPAIPLQTYQPHQGAVYR